MLAKYPSAFPNSPSQIPVSQLFERAAPATVAYQMERELGGWGYLLHLLFVIIAYFRQKVLI